MPSKKKLKRKVKRLQKKLWSVKRDRKYTVRDLKMYQELCIELELENEELKAPKVKMWHNSEPMEITVGVNDA